MSKTAVHLKINATVMARDYCSAGFHFTLTTPNFRYSAHLFLCFIERERERDYIYIYQQLPVQEPAWPSSRALGW